VASNDALTIWQSGVAGAWALFSSAAGGGVAQALACLAKSKEANCHTIRQAAEGPSELARAGPIGRREEAALGEMLLR
jgi:hypothetical protein